jgi:hypothetical protein
MAEPDLGKEMIGIYNESIEMIAAAEAKIAEVFCQLRRGVLCSAKSRLDRLIAETKAAAEEVGKDKDHG